MRTSRSVASLTVPNLYLLFVVGLVLVLVTSVLSNSPDALLQQKTSSTIKFSHALHAKELGIACADCHTAVPTSKFSGDNLLTSHENCKSCHEEELDKNCTYCHTSDDLSTYVATVSPTRGLVFSHEFHIQEQNIECVTCHRGVEKAVKGVPMGMPGMPECYTCHNDVQASNICETCHTDLAALRPRDHNRTDFVRVHKFAARISEATCSTCHTQESCIDCHNGVDLVKVNLPGRDLMSPRAPRLAPIDRGQTTRLVKVHDLNFRFTHGIAAAGKISDCQTCHNQQTFCATCHAAGGNINQLAFKPATHAQSAFVMLGVGSGGGVHASLARRDIESCASCHDTQGADPTCITCHMDSDGIRGNDPKTHARGFMATRRGEWHDDPGSTCYACHNDPNARIDGIRGIGFCGYCHK